MHCCDNIYSDYLSHCEDLIDVRVEGLTPGTDYDIVITDKFGNQYKHSYTTEEFSDFQLDTADFPTGLFNPYIGDLLLQIYSDVCTIVDFKIDLKTYDAISFHIIGGTREKSNLGCAEVGVYG